MRCSWLVSVTSLVALISCRTPKHAVELIVQGDTVSAKPRPAGQPASDPASTQIMILALDGMSRDLLYDELRAGHLPNLATLLGGEDFAHADLDDRLLAGMPSTTLPAWSTVFTGEPPSVSGVTNNELFIRETKTFATPAPVSFVDSASTVEVYTKGGANKLLMTPTVYEKIHAHDPDALVWVVMSQFYRGADLMLMAPRTAMLESLAALVSEGMPKEDTARSDKAYAALDNGAVDGLIAHLAKGAVPDVLTLYLAGTDLYAHGSPDGPDVARRKYMIEVVDPALGKLIARMRERDMLARRWVIVTSDHGHTAVIHDAAHALGPDDEDAPGVMRAAGWKLRPFKHEVDRKDPYNAVLAYGGAIAYVYLADRSKCTGEQPCAWDAPPRYDDVLALAEAFRQSNESGEHAPGMRGALDMIFVRRPRPPGQDALPFEVFVGDGKTMPIDQYLAAHPHPTYVDLARRLGELAAGPHGDRAGDLLLLAHNGDRDRPEDRYYFATPFRSWHGSPSKEDSHVPLIVANPGTTANKIRAWVGEILGDRPYQRKVTDLVMALRKKPPALEAKE